MEPQSPTDHIALLAIMMVRVLAHRMDELGQLDEQTRSHLRRLIGTVSTHAGFKGLDDLKLLFSGIDKTLAEELDPAA